MTPDEEQRLRDEERIRYEAKRQLEPQWWSILNSGIVLWLLSSIVVSLVTYTITTWTQRFAEKELAIRRADDVEKELSSRLSNFQSRLGEYVKQLDQYRAAHTDVDDRRPSGWYEGLTSRYTQAEFPTFSRLAEFRVLSITSLLRTLERDAAYTKHDTPYLDALRGSHKEWDKVVRLCYYDYDAFNPDALNRDGHYNQVREKIEDVRALLSNGPLSHWTKSEFAR